MPTDGKICDVCGRPALVRVLEGYREGQPVMRELCADCADQAAEHDSPLEERSQFRKRGAALILIVLGLLGGFVSAFGDYLGIGDAGGFGWQQETGLALGTLLVITGALLKVDVVAVVGTVIFVLAVAADFIGFGSSHGLGWKQQLAVVFSAVLIFVGILLRRKA